MATPVTKIYNLETVGFDTVDKQLKAITKDFDAIKKAKQAAQGGLTAAIDNQDIESAKKFREELQKLKIQEQELRTQRQQMINEQKAETIARQAAIQSEKDRIKGLQDATGWYGRLTTEIKELGAAIKSVQNVGDVVSFRGQTFQFDEAIRKLQQLTAAEQDFRRQFAKDRTLVGEYTTGIVQAFKQMGLDDLIAGQVTRTQDRLNSLTNDFNELQRELRETQAAGLATDSIEKQMIDNRNEVIKLDTELSRLRTDLRGVGDIGNQINTSIGKGFSAVKSQLSSLLIQYLGVQAAISAAQSGIQDAKLSSDQFTDLEIQLNNDTKAADKLNDSLKSLDTRTTLTGLQQIADVALKAGVTAENIASVTEAIDKTKVAFGRDFGSVEQGTETFAKLINIFFDDGQITGERILKIGNSIRSLANETVASVPFLTDFSGRMAGLKQIANITLPDILGLGAGFEEFKQSAETSSTVLVKVIPKLAADTQKFADVIGITQEEFSTLINNNPAEALIAVSEALVKSGTGIEEISQALADTELGSGRITTILATLGGKADIFRDRIARAGETIEETGAITDAFAKKNNNLAATLDKLTKKFSDAGASKGFQITLGVLVTMFTFLLQNIPAIIGLLGLYALGWLTVTGEMKIAGVVTKGVNGQLLLQRLALIANNLAMGASIILTTLLRSAMFAFQAVLFVTNGILKAVTATMRLFGITTAAASGPLGVILAVLGLLASAAFGLSKAFGGTADAMDAQRRSLQALSEVQKRSAQIYTSQIAAIDSWITVIKSAATSADTKKRAVEELTKINSLFGDVIKDNVIDLKKLEEAYGKVTAAIIAQANAQASAELVAKKQERLIALTALRQDIEITTARGNDFIVNTKQLSGIQAEILKELKEASSTRNLFAPGEKTIAVTKQNLQKVLGELRDKEEAAAQEFHAFLELKDKSDAELKKFLEAGTLQAKANEVDIAKLKKAIEKLDHDIDNFIGTREDLTKKIKEREKLQKELDKLLGIEKKGGGGPVPRANQEERNALKDIDALRDAELTALELAFKKKEEFLRREQQLVRISEDGKIQIVKSRQAVRINDEIAFLNEEFEINAHAIDEKVELLEDALKTQEEKSKKAKVREKAALEKAMSEERAQIAQLNLEKIRIENQTNDKIFEIRARLLKEQLDKEVTQTVEIVQKVKEDPNISDTDKAQAQLDADKKILDLQIEFNKQMDELEKNRTNVSEKNARDRSNEILKIEAKLREDQKNLLSSEIDDARTAADKAESQIKIKAATRTIDVLQSGKSPKKIAEELLKIQRDATRELEANEVARLANELRLYEKGVRDKIKTEAEYQKLLAEFKEKEAKIIEDNINRQTTAFERFINSMRNVVDTFKESVLGIKKYSDDAAGAAEKHADAVAETQAKIKQAISEAFDLVFERQRAQVDREKDIQLQRLDNETEQLKAKSQSDAETASIEKQAEVRRAQIEKKAGEEKKKIALKELAIQFALSVMKSIAQYGLPLALLPIAAATALYAVQRATIQSQQFEEGGLIEQPGKKKQSRKLNLAKNIRSIPERRAATDVPARGGKFKGKKHKDGGTPFKFKGSDYEAEVDELAVIRTRNAPKDKKFKVEGTQMQIASAINKIGGGIDFKPGATIKKFETGGFIGQSLQAPVFTPSNTTLHQLAAGNKNDDIIEAINALKDETKNNASQLKSWATTLEVRQVTSTVTDAQKKQVRQKNIGTL